MIHFLWITLLPWIFISPASSTKSLLYLLYTPHCSDILHWINALPLVCFFLYSLPVLYTPHWITLIVQFPLSCIPSSISKYSYTPNCDYILHWAISLPPLSLFCFFFTVSKYFIHHTAVINCIEWPPCRNSLFPASFSKIPKTIHTPLYTEYASLNHLLAATLSFFLPIPSLKLLCGSTTYNIFLIIQL